LRRIDQWNGSQPLSIYTALEIYCEINIDWTDAFVGAQMLSAGQQEIYSYDRDFDRIIGLNRLKPQEA
jgi:predicted nucleic acid-binding protein